MDKKQKLDKYEKRFEWWVTPLNLFFLSLFFIIVDFATGTGSNPILGLDWALWPIIAFFFLFLLNLIVTSKIELAWAVGPSFFLIVSIFLIILDITYGNNDGWMKLDWAQIPATTVLIFGSILPTITHLGRRRKTPQKRFAEFKEMLQKENQR